MDDQRIEFAEAMIGRPLNDFERKTYLYYHEMLEEKPKLYLVMARNNGRNSALMQIAMYERMYAIIDKERDYHETQR